MDAKETTELNAKLVREIREFAADSPEMSSWAEVRLNRLCDEVERLQAEVAELRRQRDALAAREYVYPYNSPQLCERVA